MCHRWWRRGERAPGTRQIGYQWADIFSAVRPDTGDDVTLVMPSVNAKVMDLFLAHFADTLDQDAHAVMMCDGAGWHDERALTVPDNVTLALLPPYSPELNPVERVWLYLRERFLSLRVLDDTEAIIDACCQAWIDLIAEPIRMRDGGSFAVTIQVLGLVKTSSGRSNGHPDRATFAARSLLTAGLTGRASHCRSLL